MLKIRLSHGIGLMNNLARYFWGMFRLINLLIGFIAVIPGIIMALGLWHMINTLPALYPMINRTLGSFVIIAVVAFMQPQKDIKKVSQLGIAIGFLWTMTALIMELEL